MMVEKGQESDQFPPRYSNGHSVASEAREDGSFIESVDHDSVPMIQLNFAFLHDYGGYPSPLPLIVPESLIQNPSIGLRPIIIDRLKEEGITVALGEIRFWRTNAPLSSRIALSGLKNWNPTPEDGERSFTAIPFTESISSSLDQNWISNQTLVHLIVTDPSTSSPGSLSDPNPGTVTSNLPSTVVMIPEIVTGNYYLGYYQGRKDGKEVGEGERHSKDVDLPLSSEGQCHFAAQLPSILLGISRFSTGAPNHEIHIMSHASDVHLTGFRVHLDAFGRTFLYNGRLNWMAIRPPQGHQLRNADALQWGTVDSQSSHPRKVGRRSATIRVPFRRAYQQPPMIFSCLAGFIIGGTGSTHWDIRTFVTGVDQEGFNLHIEKSRDSEKDAGQVLAHALVTWVAIPSGKHSVTCGEFYLQDGTRTETDNGKTVEWTGKSKFLQEFSSQPQVFVAFKSFDATKSDDARMEVEIEKTTTKGIEWKVKTWCGTVLYSAAMGFVAVGAL